MRTRSILLALALAATAVVTTAAPAGAQALMCDDRPATIVGTNGNDIIRGTPGPDVIVALGGNDKIFGGDGGDVICAGPGNDRVRGQRGNDLIIGGSGDDVLFGNAGGDQLFGLTGKDKLWGGVGPDEIAGGPGNDVIKAGHGNDLAIGGLGNDRIEGSTGRDGLFGNDGNDRILGGKGFDEIYGGNGNDLLIAGPGDDYLQGDAGFNSCRIDHRDTIQDCQGGAVSGNSGVGFGSFRPTLTDDFALDAPGGPHYILHLNAVADAGGLTRVRVRDTNRVIIFDAEFDDDTFGNLLVSGGLPDEVEIFGASTWTAAFVKEKVIFHNAAKYEGFGDDAFAIFPSQDGRDIPTSIEFTNTGNTQAIFILMSVGNIGLNVEINELLQPGESKFFTGGTRASAKYIAVYAGDDVEWTFKYDSFQGSGSLSVPADVPAGYHQR